MTCRVAIYLPDLSGGGAERLHVNLAPELIARGIDVRFVVDRAGGELEPLVPDGVPRIVLGVRRQLAALPRLIRYLRQDRPDVLIANMEHMNIMAILARLCARTRTRIVVTQHNSFSAQVARPSWQWRILPFLYRWLLPRADAIVAVSAGVADDLARRSGVARERITVIHNGVVTTDFAERMAGEPDHAWFGEGRPVIVAMGRLVQQKDFATLIAAMAHVPEEARLMILGEGPLRADLEAQAREAGIAERVAMPGFASNPLPYLRRARLFVLSSRFEGFGNVIAEALATGTPVVSTNCPYGPSEILGDGRFGALTPPGDSAALGAAITRALDEPPAPDQAQARGRDFSVAHCAARYVALFQNTVAAPALSLRSELAS